MREGAMAAGSDNHLVYIALALAAVAAIATAPADGAETWQKLQWLLVVSAAPEAVTSAVTIDGTTAFPVSP
jgi:hypothetical protein